mmetsp:Transcript_29184/g.49496  ORF Transcript_29184/g.49496 Transcript_29184/m.49496 type:complete len:88 (-) Transcript_29184:274-537(-)
MSQVNQRRTACQFQQCRNLEEEDPNCTPMCVSEGCFLEVYGGNELEPGEIDVKRNRAFSRCAQKELMKKAKEARLEEARKKQTGRKK